MKNGKHDKSPGTMNQKVKSEKYEKTKIQELVTKKNQK